MKNNILLVVLGLMVSANVYAAPLAGLYVKKNNTPHTKPGRGAANCAIFVHRAEDGFAEISYVDDPRFYPYGSCGTELSNYPVGVAWTEYRGFPAFKQGVEVDPSYISLSATKEDLSEVASKGGDELWKGVFVHTGGRDQIGSRIGCALVPRKFLAGDRSGVQVIHVHDPRNLPKKTCSVHGRLEIMDLDISNKGEFGHYKADYSVLLPHLSTF